jgi:nitrilase
MAVLLQQKGMVKMAADNRIAAIQMLSTSDIDENLLAAAHFLSNAHSQGAKLALLPENFALMSVGVQIDMLTAFSEEAQKKVHGFLSSQAKKISHVACGRFCSSPCFR